MIERLRAALSDRYAIDRELGAGGMAIVYQATDRKHDRQVALKVLRPELAAVVGGERFLAEIRTTANLQHPHILPLFDSGEEDGLLWYAMPYVEGESLQERIDRERQLPVAEAIEIARKVGGALQEAHDRGVVHRDVKPANILLDHRGEPLVADFGIALAVQEAGGGRLTETGLSLGTPYYMSPEQAAGDQDPDARSDLWSLACVLYEMLTGEPPFRGGTAQAVLGRILTGDPGRATIARQAVPVHVDHALATALQKIPADRFRSVREFVEALSSPDYRSPALRRTEAKSRPPWIRDARSVAALVAVALVGVLGAVGWLGRDGSVRPSAGPVRFIVEGDGIFQTFGIRDDGALVVGGIFDGGDRGFIGVRRPDNTELDTLHILRPIEDSVGGAMPLVGAGGKRLLMDRKRGEDWRVVALDLHTGVLTEVMNVPFSAVELWAESDTSILATAAPSGRPELFRLNPVSGRIDTLGIEGAFPRPLPDGRHYLVNQAATSDVGIFEAWDVAVVEIETGESRVLLNDASSPSWVEPGLIVFAKAPNRLLAAPFDLDRLELAAPPRVVANDAVGRPPLLYYAASDRMLSYSRSAGTFDFERLQLVWEGPGGPQPVGPRIDHFDVRLSPAADRIAYTDGGQIHIVEIASNRTRQLTFSNSEAHDPVWTPDGRDVVYLEYIGDPIDSSRVMRVPADGSRNPVEIAGLHPYSVPQQVLTDGTLLLTPTLTGDDQGVWRLRPGASVPERALDLPDQNEIRPRVSPDGAYMAYVAAGEGAGAFVRRYPSMEGLWRVWDGRVDGLEWSPDGDALYLLDGETSRIVRLELEVEGAFAVGAETRPRLEMPVSNLRGVGPDGRLLFGSPAPFSEGAAAATGALLVVLNWDVELTGLFGGGDSR